MHRNSRSRMSRRCPLAYWSPPACWSHRASPMRPSRKPSMRGVLVRMDRVSPGFLAAWKAKGVNAVVVPLDDAAKQRWKPMAEAVERAGMTLWPWIEVARNPAMADAHPEWMAAIGGHHDDWRRRFPDARRRNAARSSRHGRGFRSAMLRPSTPIGNG